MRLNAAQLLEILDSHDLWVQSDGKEGKQANLGEVEANLHLIELDQAIRSHLSRKETT